MTLSILVGVTNRHVHLSREHLDTLFGKNYTLTVEWPIRQPGQFAAQEKVILVGKVELEARVVGPVRAQTQVEILREDQPKLGISAPERLSGSIDDTPGIVLRGPRGEVRLTSGLIIAKKHLHMHTDEAPTYGLHANLSYVDLQTSSGYVFERIPLRIGSTHKSEFHLDRDEAEEREVKTGEYVTLLKTYTS